MVFAIFRHGARAPTKWSWMTECINSFQKEDITQLTNIGKNQSFNNGFNTRLCYPSLFKNFDAERDVKVYSRPIDRTKESAKSFLEGLENDFINVDMAKITDLYQFRTVNDHDDQQLKNAYSEW